MKLSSDLNAFQTRLGYRFSKPDLLVQALTHSSISSHTRPSNERLEFLGDRVLGLVMAQALIAQDEKATEGQIAPRFNALVRKETCADVAREIDLGAVLKLGRSEMKTGGRRKNALLGDGIEAVIAAIYLDGGFEAAQKVILHLWGARLHTLEDDARDAKTTLQEMVQGRGQALPAYHLIARTGPDHAPEFTIEVRLDSGETAQGTANSKRRAEQAAAQDMLGKLS